MSAAHQSRSGSTVSPSATCAIVKAQEVGPRRLEQDASPVDSPARDLQAALVRAIASEPEVSAAKWSGAVRLSIIGGGSLFLWTAIIVGIRALF